MIQCILAEPQMEPLITPARQANLWATIRGLGTLINGEPDYYPSR